MDHQLRCAVTRSKLLSADEALSQCVAEALRAEFRTFQRSRGSHWDSPQGSLAFLYAQKTYEVRVFVRLPSAPSNGCHELDLSLTLRSVVSWSEALRSSTHPLVREFLRENAPTVNPAHFPGLVNWLETGERGSSAETIVSYLTGIPIIPSRRWSAPLDFGDFRRCHALLEAVPSLDINKMASLAAWAPLVAVWGQLTALHLQGQGGRLADAFFDTVKPG